MTDKVPEILRFTLNDKVLYRTKSSNQEKLQSFKA